jgi:hypothetical protein
MCILVQSGAACVTNIFYKATFIEWITEKPIKGKNALLTTGRGGP